MDLLKQLDAAVAYLEESLCGGIDMEKLTRITCTDSGSFARFFSYMTGMTLRDYVRRRRLTLAGYELRKGGKVIDIAVKYGYESADSFARAFKKQHGITPSEARDPALPLRVYPPVSFRFTVKGAEAMNFRLVTLTEQKVYGLSRTLEEKQEEHFALEHIMWDEKGAALPAKICEGYDGIWYGIWQGSRYTIARAADDVTYSGLEEVIIPAGEYAVFATGRGGFAGDELPKLRELIFGSWLPDSGYEPAGDTEIEIYHLWTDRDIRRKNRWYEIMIPVRKGSEEAK